MKDYKKLLKNKEYDFLRENQHLGSNIILLNIGGSIAYGTNIETSDVDLRGIALNSKYELIGVNKDFEQVEDKATDTTIYSLKKIVELFMECNPNTIEMLGCNPEHYLYKTREGEIILQNKDAFLSNRAIKSFGGYARDQFNRLEHGLLGNGANSDKQIAMLKKSLENCLDAFNTKHENAQLNLNLRILEREEEPELWDSIKHTNKCEEYGEDLLITGQFKDYPVSEFKCLLNEMHGIQSTYGNKNHRNNKKTGPRLAKHQMHLARLYIMGTELNKTGRIITYITKEHNLLMDMRNMKYMYDDGLRVRPEYYDVIYELQKEYEYSCLNTVLPYKANTEAINEMLLDIYKIL